MANFGLSELALKAVCPNNEILYDDKGMPSVMVKIPKMTYAQLGLGSSTDVFPAFIVNGVEKDAVYISKYQNIVENNRAYSLPGRDPKTSVTFDQAITYCSNKGTGWHLMTKMELGLMVRWCQKNGVMPLGNNNYGKHSSESMYKAIPSYISGGQTCRVATGTGPLTWSHDGSPSGIFDLCGNVWEWTGGVRTVYGELQVLVNNNAADSTHSQAAAGTEWKAISASDGSLITPDGSGTTSGSIKMDYLSSKLTYVTSITGTRGSYSATFANITCASGISDAAKLVLQALGMLQNGTELFASQVCYFDNSQAERSFFCGGSWGSSSFGLASFHGGSARSGSSGDVGFRSAYAEL